jgi:hypothetical protein
MLDFWLHINLAEAEGSEGDQDMPANLGRERSVSQVRLS